MMRSFADLAAMKAEVGNEVALSDWVDPGAGAGRQPGEGAPVDRRDR
jgi:hypothetical protein